MGTENAGCEVAYNMAVISSNTLLRAGEIWQLRLHNLDLERRTIACSNKNGSVRHVPLNDEAYAAVRRLRDRAEKLGSTEPEHYLLPRRRKGGAFGSNKTPGLLGTRLAQDGGSGQASRSAIPRPPAGCHDQPVEFWRRCGNRELHR